MTSIFGQCCYGLASPYEGKPIEQQPTFLQNIPAIHAEFGDRYCACRVDHQPILGSIGEVSRSRYSQVYTQNLCKAMVRQIAYQLYGGGGPAAAIRSGRTRSSRSRSRRIPEVVPWTFDWVMNIEGSRFSLDAADFANPNDENNKVFKVLNLVMSSQEKS